jgi:hypothetical protein
MKKREQNSGTGLLLMAVSAALLLAGCPYAPTGSGVLDDGAYPYGHDPESPYYPAENDGASGLDAEAQAEYDIGFDEGFARDDKYWLGFYDGYDTIDAGPVYYSGSEIPYVEAPPHDAGYWDGVWYAYNDGYFVEYDYAFTIGFSEGYDLAFAEDGLDFLFADTHIEYLDGGFSDGYHDGFSEGRILGAADYLEGYEYDWLAALWYYRDGNDIYLEDVDLGTGEYGPVELYEYGIDPIDLIAKKDAALRRDTGRRPVPAIRRKKDEKSFVPDLVYRPMTADAAALYDIAPLTTPRSGREVLLESTWLERIQVYEASFAKSAPPQRKKKSQSAG